jgi:hypothetical protein
VRVDAFAFDDEGVAAGACLEQGGPVWLGASERLAEIGDLDLERVGGVAREVIAPEDVHEEVGRDGLPGAQQEGQ